MIEEIRSILIKIGEDPARDGLLNTPLRVSQSLRFLTSGYRMNEDDLLNKALFDVAYDEMVIGRVIGLSKIPRLVDMYARRLQVQERLTRQIAETIDQKIRPRGVAVVIEAQ